MNPARLLLGFMLSVASVTHLDSATPDPGSLTGHLPANAHAGPRSPVAADRKVVVEVSVADHGARGDDDQDDSPGFAAALAELKRRMDTVQGALPCGVLVVPPGRYLLSSILYLDRDDLVLRGAGSQATRLEFIRSLSDLFKVTEESQPGSSAQWSFRGGLVWLARDPLTVPAAVPAAIPIPGEVPAGATRIKIAAADLAAVRQCIGTTVHLRWLGDQTWRDLVFGHAAAAQVDWRRWELIDRQGRVRWEDAHRIVAVEDEEAILAKPLRLPIHPDWQVVLARRTGNLERVAVTGLTIAMPKHYPLDAKGKSTYVHLKEPGWNAIFLLAAVDASIEDVRIENADVGIALERSQHCLIRGLRIIGDEHHRAHHGVTFRYGANDNLLEDFVIESPVHHGVSVQDLAAGNVIRRGRFLHGTAECHRGMPFDLIRTDLEFVRCDGYGGGADIGGPFCGRRVVGWNLRFLPPPADLDERSRERWHSGARLLINPHQFSQGAVVGVQGLDPVGSDERLWAMPPGDKGTVTHATGTTPDPPDLYEWQRQHHPLP